MEPCDSNEVTSIQDGSAATSSNEDEDEDEDEVASSENKAVAEEEWDSEDSHSELWARHEWADRAWQVPKHPEGEPETWWIPDPVEIDSANSEYLCELCRHVNYAKLLDVAKWKAGNIGSFFQLGTLDETLERGNCAFCRLIIGKVLNYKDRAEFESGQPLRKLEGCTIHISSPGCTVNSIRLTVEVRNVSENGDSRQNMQFHIQEIADEPGKGRIVSRDTVVTGLPKQWLDNCLESPANLTGLMQKDMQSPLDLDYIDVESLCVTRVAGSCKYTALSYIWGGVQQIQYTSNTQARLERQGGLAERAAKLPRTVRDAMLLTSSLGLRYLWVDALCIMQDDPVRKGVLIPQMANIYGGATVTIVAAAGENSEAGLLGIGVLPRSKAQHIETVQGLRLATVLSVFDDVTPLEDINGSKWNTRGWTYQERMLSRRLLFVSDTQISFICNHPEHAPCFEDTHEIQSDNKDDPNEWDRSWGSRRDEHDWKHLLLDKDEWWKTYSTAVTAYSGRNLTFEADIINAFEGIVEHLRTQRPIHTAFNNLDTELDYSLLWEPIRYVTRRPRTEDQFVPSWSWAAWKGEVEFRVYWENSRPWPLKSSVIWIAKSTEPWPKQSSWPKSVTQATDGCLIHLDQEQDILVDSQTYRCHDWRDRGWQMVDDSVYTSSGTIVPPPHTPAFISSVTLSLVTPEGHLDFLCFSAPVRALSSGESELAQDTADTRIQIGGSDTGYGEGYRSLRADFRYWRIRWRPVFDAGGYRIGMVTLNAAITSSLPLLFLAMSRIHDNVHPLAAGLPGMWTIKEQAISEWDPALFDNISYPPDCEQAPYNPFPDIDGTTPSYFDLNKYASKWYAWFNVLLVEDDGSGVLRRVGVGQVHVDGLWSAGAVWERLCLG